MIRGCAGFAFDCGFEILDRFRKRADLRQKLSAEKVGQFASCGIVVQSEGGSEVGERHVDARRVTSFRTARSSKLHQDARTSEISPCESRSLPDHEREGLFKTIKADQRSASCGHRGDAPGLKRQSCVVSDEGLLAIVLEQAQFAALEPIVERTDL